MLSLGFHRRDPVGIADVGSRISGAAAGVVVGAGAPQRPEPDEGKPPAMTIGDSLILTRRPLAVLRESDRPMPTDELAELMPCKVERTRQGGCEWWCGAETPAGVRVRECHRSWHLVEYQRTSHGFTGIYCHLCALEGRGLAHRCRVEGDRRVFWACRGDDNSSRDGQSSTKPAEATSSERSE